jgi:hypothetical protein
MLKIEREVTYWYIVFCNECNLHGPQAWSEAKVNEKAKKQGWMVLENGDHYCPEHIHTHNAIMSQFDDLELRLNKLQKQNSERNPPTDDEEQQDSE